MSTKQNLQKGPIPLDLIGSAVEVLKLIMEAAAKRMLLKGRVQLLENTDLTQAHQFVKFEERLDSLTEEVKMLRGVIRDITEKEIKSHFEKQAQKQKALPSEVPGILAAPTPEGLIKAIQEFRISAITSAEMFNKRGMPTSEAMELGKASAYADVLDLLKNVN